MQTKISNPVLTGFNPDPSILRANGKYYIATSTFEYYPGVQIFESEDLANWKVVDRPVTDEMEDRRGITQGGGVWAPCLTFDGEQFYLVYSRVVSWAIEPFKDVENFVITTKEIGGKWSKPVYINSDGFDCSLFHDGDKSYYVGVRWDYRKPVGAPQFSGILCWEFARKTKKLIGEPVNIFKGTDRGLVEAPHIYKVGEYYYLFTAEGGTNVEHAETVARSKNVFGPYELHPNKHLISSYKTDNPLQKAGHGCICQDEFGNWYFAHLCGRKIFGGNCVLGRETSIQNLVFKDGWPYLAHGGSEPRSFFYSPYGVEKREDVGGVIPFNDYTLKNVYMTLRAPLGDRLKVLSERSVELTGYETPISTQLQSALLVRQDSPCFTASVRLDFKPEKFTHVAGLSYRYDEADQYLLYVSFDETIEKNVLSVFRIVNGNYRIEDLKITVGDTVYLKVKANTEGGQFYYSVDGKTFKSVGEPLDVTCLSDEGAKPMGFTGAFVGFYAGDYSSKSKTAIFSDFSYERR